MPKIVYPFKDALYINLTNRCPNACKFCLKTKFSMNFEGFNLNLQGAEPSSQQVLAEVYANLNIKPIKELVFCGYGEPTMRLGVLLDIAQTLKAKIAAGEVVPFTIRLNTIGLANLVHKKDITPQLAQVLDSINISLNSPDKQQWQRLVLPQTAYINGGFEAVLSFISLCAKQIPDTVVSIVAGQMVDEAAAAKIVQGLGAKLYIRKFI